MSYLHRFVDIVNDRDSTADNLSEMAIYGHVMENIVNINLTEDEKTDFIIQSFSDPSIVLSQLAMCKSRGLLSNIEYRNLINIYLAKISNTRQDIHFNPIKLYRYLNDF